MNSIKNFVLIAAAAAVVALVSNACGPVKKDCGPSNCPSGCCDESGVCQLGSLTNQCGTSGFAGA